MSLLNRSLSFTLVELSGNQWEARKTEYEDGFYARKTEPAVQKARAQDIYRSFWSWFFFIDFSDSPLALFIYI